jgi:ribonuclease D
MKYWLCESPTSFQAVTASLTQYKELWIDTEVADCHARAPRLSLLQVRAGDAVYVVDVLRDGMDHVVE